MNSRTLVVAVLIAASATLGGCGRVKQLMSSGKPEGQVVATVNGDEITSLELRQEMGSFASRDLAVMKAAQQRALQGLIMRRLVVQNAKDQKLDKTPEYSLQLRRGEDALLAQLFQRKVASGIAAPSRDEAEAYVSSHPEKFANRRVLVVDQLIAAQNKISPERLRPIKTYDELRALLDAEHVAYQSTVATVDTLTADPRLLAQIEKLPADEIFVIPQGGGLVFNRIIEARPVPFQGDPAVAFAINALRTQRAQEAVARQLELMRKSAESKIVYNEAYKPAPAAKPGAAAPAAAN